MLGMLIWSCGTHARAVLLYRLDSNTIQRAIPKPTMFHAHSFVVHAGFSMGVSPKAKLPKQTYCTIGWGEGESSTHKWQFHKNGRARDTFALRNCKLMVKAEIVGKENRNKSEWDLYTSTPAIRDFIPEVTDTSSRLSATSLCHFYW